MTRLLTIAVATSALAAVVLPLNVAILAWMAAVGVLMIAASARGMR